MLNFGPSKPRVKGGPGPPLDPRLINMNLKCWSVQFHLTQLPSEHTANYVERQYNQTIIFKSSFVQACIFIMFGVSLLHMVDFYIKQFGGPCGWFLTLL